MFDLHAIPGKPQEFTHFGLVSWAVGAVLLSQWLDIRSSWRGSMATWDSVSASWRCLRGDRYATVVPSLPRILKVHGIRGAPVSGLPLTKFGDIPTITLQHTYIYTHISISWTASFWSAQWKIYSFLIAFRRKWYQKNKKRGTKCDNLNYNIWWGYSEKQVAQLKMKNRTIRSSFGRHVLLGLNRFKLFVILSK